MSRPSAVVARQRAGWSARERSSFGESLATRQSSAYEIRLNSTPIIKARRFSTACQDAPQGFTRQMKKLPGFLRENLTYDRGLEMTCHVELTERLNLDIWFADPYAPWQRGSTENTNGLLRQFLPKGADLSGVTQIQSYDIAKLRNGRPRQTLHWKTLKRLWRWNWLPPE